MKDLYTENHKTVMKQIEEDTNKWKDIPCSRIGRISIVRMARSLKAICSSNAISNGKESACNARGPGLILHWEDPL